MGGVTGQCNSTQPSSKLRYIYPKCPKKKKHSLCVVREKKNMSILLIIMIFFVMFIMYNVKFSLLFYGDRFSFRGLSSVNKELNLCLLLWAPHAGHTAGQGWIAISPTRAQSATHFRTNQIICCSRLCSAVYPLTVKSGGRGLGELNGRRFLFEFCSVHKDFQINNKVKATRELVLKQRRNTGIEPRALFEEMFQ